MVEQWPLKPLVEGSSPSGCTRGEIPTSSHKALGKCRGLLVSPLIISFHHLSKAGHNISQSIFQLTFLNLKNLTGGVYAEIRQAHILK